MRIVVPHTPTGLRPETLAAVLEQAPNVEFAELYGESAYWQLWRDLWSGGEAFAVVEQDIVVHSGTFPEFEACAEPWCAHAYDYGVFGMYAGTGCVRFSAELLQATPGLIDRVGQLFDDTHPPKHWCRLDAWMQNELHAAGYRQHRHEPPVEHLDTGVSHGCVALT